MATASSGAPVRDTSLQETTGDKTDNGIVVSACHPSWLRALWHYDRNYDYDLEHHEYDEFHTTDPYYIDSEVRLSPTPEHSVFLDRAGRNLEAFLELHGRYCPITREVPIQNLEALPAYPGLAQYCLFRMKWVYHDGVCPSLSELSPWRAPQPPCRAVPGCRIT